MQFSSSHTFVAQILQRQLKIAGHEFVFPLGQSWAVWFVLLADGGSGTSKSFLRYEIGLQESKTGSGRETILGYFCTCLWGVDRSDPNRRYRRKKIKIITKIWDYMYMLVKRSSFFILADRNSISFIVTVVV